MLYAPGPRGPTETEPDLPLIVWVSPVEARVSSGLMQEQGLWLQQTCPRSMWHKPSWRRSPLAPSYSHWADNPQTAKQLYQRNSHTVKKVLGHTTDFPTGDLAKRLRTLSEFELEASWIWLQTSTGLGKQTLGGHKQNLLCTKSQEKGAVSPWETDSDFPVSFQESLVEAWVDRMESLPQSQSLAGRIPCRRASRSV